VTTHCAAGKVDSMGRKPRNAYADGLYHVHARGNNKLPLYLDALDRNVFLQLVERSQEKYEWVVLEWCLMTNHFHLVLRVPRNGLSQGMSELNGSFARWSNKRHGRGDHLFGRRYTSNELTTDQYLLEACRYVVLNPVRAGVCSHPARWEWSSYRASARLARPRPFHARDELLAMFADVFGTSPNMGHVLYRQFVEARLGIERQRAQQQSDDGAVALLEGDALAGAAPPRPATA
jgi:REP element-mobilizing transposase RayT